MTVTAHVLPTGMQQNSHNVVYEAYQKSPQSFVYIKNNVHWNQCSYFWNSPRILYMYLNKKNELYKTGITFVTLTVQLYKNMFDWTPNSAISVVFWISISATINERIDSPFCSFSYPSQVSSDQHTFLIISSLCPLF